MGAVGGLLGVSGGAAGTGFATPKGTAIQKPVTTQQGTDAYTANQSALAGQQNLLQALQAQQGLQNQNNVYGQLQNVAAGQGPNPALAMLNQQTGQNVANQAALMAGQRGASQNAGLIARQAAQQGAATQQQAVGQGASLQAQQSLNALGAAGNLATTQAGQQIGQTNANTQAQQSEQQNLLNAIAAQNNASVGLQSNINNANSSLANTTMQGTQNTVGGLMNSSGGIGALLGAEGGVVDAIKGFLAPDFAKAEQQKNQPPPNMDKSTAMPLSKYAGGGDVAGPRSMFGQFLAGVQSPPLVQPELMSPNAPENKTAAAFKGKPGAPPPPPEEEDQIAPPGGSTPGMEDPGISQKPSMANQLNSNFFSSGGNVGSKLKQGGHVPGKPKVGGSKNSYANDNVKALLSPGEIVLPRSVTQSKDPVGEAAKFVQAVMAKRKSCAA